MNVDPVFQALTRLPPAFAGNTWLYGGAIFSLMLITSLSVAALVQIVYLARLHPEPLRNPASLHRVGVAGLLLTLLLGAAPDAVFMLAWGDAAFDARHLEMIAAADRVLDFGAVVPFVASLVSFTLGQQAITYQLIRRPLPVDLISSLPLLRRPVTISVLCAALALGVAVAK